MSHNKNSHHDKKNSAQIVGIQFSILSPDEIRKMSVAEITTRDTYENNKPKINGLFDPRMGVLERGFICPTDGLDYINTPGYFGHLELAKPVFYIQYLNTVIKVLRSVCFKCSKLLISKEKHNHIINKNNEDRWNYVFQNANKIRTCGQETKNGCGCKQPKYTKDGFATLYAEWEENDNGEESKIKITPELALKILRRISDIDVDFMGFSSTWSRPDWMICQVLAVPPPSVRPSVKHDVQQRSEDDITHILCNIFKTNKTLSEKLEAGNVSENVIDDWTTLLQYYIATQVDNKIPGVAAVAQRSGRPLKSIKERLNGKTGRVRGNLMGKRVDYSARSVITADPNLSIAELGVPEKIAKNVTKPVVVNSNNKNFLMKLIENGPNRWPGAKMLEKKNKECISLRYADVKNLSIENGDIVHRHMMDGDPVLFNRQPTLHRMSMMCHRAKIMKIGDTFRMNVADTKPYNADFDGDEMNLHMPQDTESELELLHLAAVPNQLISPASNSTIVGIFQDSLLGCYRFTRENINFSKREAMNLLMNCKNINLNILKNDKISSFEILSQITPPISLNQKNKQYKDEEDSETSNNILNIKNGVYYKGQLDKSLLGASSKGILHRVCNDFGNKAASDYIDNLQNIITDYMKQSSYSVGPSDLISNIETQEKIIDIITKKKKDVKELIDRLQIGNFKNDSDKSKVEEFETQVKDLLNEATQQAGKIGRNKLDKNNRFVIMVNAGSKGSDLNISQMISCLGQQNVNGKRIPYGFDDRTLPHFTKYDDSPGARGFVESSYIGGLTPEELFFHAMGGRVGLIDTAVKTSQTGYIQRRLIKGMEDLKVEYDMSVRNNKGKIVQFTYGDNGMDSVKVEKQILPLYEMSSEDIYNHYYIADDKSNKGIKPFIKSVQSKLNKQKEKCNEYVKDYIDKTIKLRKKIISNVWKNKNEAEVYCSVAFHFIINNIQHQCNLSGNSLVDISPLECFQILEKYMKKLEKIHYCKPTNLFKVLYMFYLSPRNLLFIKRFNRSSLQLLMETIVMSYKKGIVAPGEMVGMIAAQSIGEPTTQMTLNTFHFAGVASKSNVTRGVPRIEEILSLTENIKNPSLTIKLHPDDELDRSKATQIMYSIENTKLMDIVKETQICFDPNEESSIINDDHDFIQRYNSFENLIDSCRGIENTSNDESEKSKWIIRIVMNPETMLEKNITMDDVYYTLNTVYSNEISCTFSDYNYNNLVFRIRMNKKDSKKKAESLDQSDDIYILKNLQENLLNNIVLRGIKKINKVILRKVLGVSKNKDGWILDTVGSNLMDVLALDYIDFTETFTNNIIEMYNVLGIEAARQSIYNELSDVIEFDGSYINSHHMNLLSDRMTYNTKMISIFRHGINNDDIGPIAKASFEETPEMFLKAARHGELDIMKGVSANVMCGQEGNFGTSCFQILLDNEKLTEDIEYELDEDILEDLYKNEQDEQYCSTDNINIKQLNISNMSVDDDDDDYNLDI